MNRLKYVISILVLSLSTVACNPATTVSADKPSPAITSSDATGLLLNTERSLPLGANEVSSIWSQTCALCHANGEGGAPRIGVSADWEPRLAQGKAVLMAHTIEGYNDMPPLGYCMSCDREEFSALIDFMTGESP